MCEAQGYLYVLLSLKTTYEWIMVSCYHGMISSFINVLQLINCTRFVIWWVLLHFGTGFVVDLPTPVKKDCPSENEAILVNICRLITWTTRSWIEYRYITVEYNAISIKKKHQRKAYYCWDFQLTRDTHNSPSPTSYRVSFVSFPKKVTARSRERTITLTS